MKLILLRHGDAVPDAPGGDRDRRLAPGAREAAARTGRVLMEEGHRAELALISPARRTRETWEALSEEFRDGVDAREADSLYNADVATLIDALTSVDGDVIVIGHNPALSQLSMLLASEGAVPLRPGEADVLDVRELRPGGAKRIAHVSGGAG